MKKIILILFCIGLVAVAAPAWSAPVMVVDSQSEYWLPLDAEGWTVVENTDELQIDWADGGRLEVRFDGIEGAEFATETDSLEAIRNQGDTAWATATEVGLSDGAITAAKIAADAIGASEVAAGALVAGTEITGLADETDIRDAILNAIIEELSTIPSTSNITVGQVLSLLSMLEINEKSSTSSIIQIKNNAGTVIGEATISDNGTTMTRSKLTNP